MNLKVPGQSAFPGLPLWLCLYWHAYLVTCLPTCLSIFLIPVSSVHLCCVYPCPHCHCVLLAQFPAFHICCWPLMSPPCQTGWKTWSNGMVIWFCYCSLLQDKCLGCGWQVRWLLSEQDPCSPVLIYRVQQKAVLIWSAQLVNTGENWGAGTFIVWVKVRKKMVQCIVELGVEDYRNLRCDIWLLPPFMLHTGTGTGP